MRVALNCQVLLTMISIKLIVLIYNNSSNDSAAGGISL